MGIQIHPQGKGPKQGKAYGKGLSGREAERRYRSFGPNAISRRKKVSPIGVLFKQFSDFMVIILLACTAASVFMGEMTESLTIIAIVVINALLGFIQEYRSERSMEALRSLAAPTARVIRDGRQLNIPAEFVVPGDLIVLEAGDRVPADAVLVESKSLQVDESLLTGESIAVEKSSLPPGKAGIAKQADRANMVYMGTLVTSGKGMALVTATGMKTEMGEIADMIQNIGEEETPLQKRLDHLGRFIVYGCLAICAVVSVTGVLRGEPVFSMLLAGISLAVAAVPEGLPAVVTIALALGVQRMYKRNALVRKLPAVETLGCATVICSDKTGTLTENKMTVIKIYTPDGTTVDVEGSGNSMKGAFLCQGREIDPLKDKSLRLILEAGILCNNAKITAIRRNGGAFKKFLGRQAKAGAVEISGDPTEGALLVAGLKAGLTAEELGGAYYRVDELPFDSDRKCMSVVCSNPQGELFVFSKGAPDVIVEKCRMAYTSRGVVPLDGAFKARIMKANDSMGEKALRVLAVAFKRHAGRDCRKESVEEGLVFLGLVGMIDPPRKEAVEAVKRCKMAGIKPIMVTGDHRLTATAIGRKLGIYSPGQKVVTGAQLEEMTDSQLEREINSISVYARVLPRHKLRIVRALKKTGHIVAMTGDGVNDAPAVKEADIGISMGMTGTDVTKEASSMILLDDNFATIVTAVEEGRVIYSNIRKFIRYLLSCNLGEVVTMFLAMLLGLPLPLFPIQILWVNLVTDGLPAIALGFDPPEEDVMTMPPRGTNEHIFSRGLSRLILVRGALIGFSTLAVLASVLYFTGSTDLARTSAFMTLVLTQLIHVFECKSERRSILEVPLFNNMGLVMAALVSLAMELAVIYIPFLRSIFKTVPLTSNEWLLIAGFSLLGPIGSCFSGKRR